MIFPCSGHSREVLSMEELDPDGEGDELLALMYPDFFGPSAPSYVSPLANYEQLEAVIANMLENLMHSIGWILYIQNSDHSSSPCSYSSSCKNCGHVKRLECLWSRKR